MLTPDREQWRLPVLTTSAELLLRWLRFHRRSREGEEMLQAALTEIGIDQADFGRALLELAREGYVRFEVTFRG